MNPPGAHAAATLRVTPGGKFTGNAGSTSFKDVTADLTLKCKSATLAGSISKTVGIAPPAKFGFISTGTFGTTALACSGPLGEKFYLTLSAAMLNVTTFNAATGVIKGKLTGIKATLHGVSFSCTAALSGSQPYSYGNSTHRFHVLGSSSGDSLTTGTVTGCLGVIRTGDKDFIRGTYTVAPAQTVASS